MAARLGIEGTTVDTHLRRVRDRLGARNTPHLIGIVVGAGIISNPAPVIDA